MTEENGGSKVNFSVKELIEEVLSKLAVIEDKLNKKADVEDLNSVTRDVKDHERRLTVLETRSEDKRNFFLTWAPAAATIVAALIIIWATFK